MAIAELDWRSEVESSSLELASVACGAAIELDNLLAGKDVNLASLVTLRERLSREIEIPGSHYSIKSLMDPTTATAVNKAIAQSGVLDVAPRTMDDLVEGTKEIRERLGNVAQDPNGLRLDREEVEKLRSFCLKLSRSISANLVTPSDVYPSEPF